MTISLEEANRVLEAAYPHQGVSVKAPVGGGAYKVLKTNGEVIGSAFNLEAACKQAVMPALKEEAARRAAADKARTAEFILFQKFIQERFASEFTEWKQTRAAPEASEPPGAPHGEPRLVSLLSP